MDISKLAGISNLQSSFDEAMKISKGLEEQTNYARINALSFNSSIHELLKHQKLTAKLPTHLSATLSIVKEFEDQANRWKKLTEPLSQFRASMLASEQMVKILDQSLLRLSKERLRLIESLSAPINALRMSDEISKQMLSISALHTERFAELSNPYKNLFGSIHSQTFASKTVSEILEQQDVIKSLQLPIIDAATANAIVGFWGRDGVEKQLRSFGIEYDQLIQHLDDNDSASQKNSTIRFKLPRIDFWTAFSILMAILMYVAQGRDAAQMEGRLTTEIKRSKDEVLKSNQLIGQLLQSLIDMQQPNEVGDIQYVVRARVAKIRISPKAGSQIVAEIFPNQVVTQLDKRGKWVQINYFDWLKQDMQTGWILKKYLVRVPGIKQKVHKEGGYEQPA